MASGNVIKIGVDDGNLTKTLQDIRKNMSSLRAEGSALNGALKLTGDTGILGKKLSNLRTQEAQLIQQSNGLKAKLAEVNKASLGKTPTADAIKLKSEIGKTDAQLLRLQGEISRTKGNIKIGADSSGIKEAETHTRGLGIGLKGLAVGAGAVALVSSAIGVLKDNIDSAVERFDTLNAYPKVMKQMGYSTQDTNKSVGILKKGVDGLPTSLQDLTKSAQSFAILEKNATKGAQTATALNDAFLASGASAGDASRGVEQYSQMLASGTVDLQSWKTLQETMPYALTTVAKSFGLTGKSAERDLYAKLKSGKITMEQLNARFIQLDGGANGFANTARTATGGIGTSFTNMANAISKGMADTLTAIDNGMKSAGLNGGIAGVFDGVKNVINSTFTVINGTVTTGIGQIVSGFSGLTPIISTVQGIFSKLDFSGLQAVASAILPALQAGFSTFLAFVAPAFQPLLNAVKDLWNSLQPIITTVAGALMPVFQILGAFLGGFISGVMSGLTFAFKVATVAIQVLTPVIQAVIAVFKFLSPVLVAVAGFVGVVVGSFSGMGAVGKAVAGAIGAAFKFMGGILGGIFSAISSSFRAVGTVFSGVGQAIGAIARAIVGFFTGIGGRIAGNFGGIVGRIGSFFSGIGGMIGGVVRNIVGFFTGIPGKIASKFSGIASSIRGHFNVDLSGAGRAIINGFVGGLKSAWNAGKKFIGGIGEWIKEHKGPISYDRRLLIPAGNAIMTGFNEGLTKQFSNVKRNVGGMASVLANQFGGGLNVGTLSPNTDLGGNTNNNSNITINVNGTNMTNDQVGQVVVKTLRRNNVI